MAGGDPLMDAIDLKAAFDLQNLPVWRDGNTFKYLGDPPPALLKRAQKIEREFLAVLPTEPPALREILELEPKPLEAAVWPARQPLPAERPEAPSLPPEMIPGPFRVWLEGVASRACVPLEMIAVPAIIAASGIIGRSVFIKPRAFSDWSVTPNLWGAVVAPPGSMKSDLIAEALWPVSRLEAKAREVFQRSQLEAETDREVLEASMGAARSKAKKNPGEAREDLLRLKGELQALEAVPEKRYSTQDATVEKLGELLRDNPRGVILNRDELASWLASLDREDSATARGFFLSAWNGSTGYTFDRIGRGTVHIPAACVSVIGGIQPGPLESVFNGLRRDPTKSDGLLQRFQVIVWPDGLPDWIAPSQWPDGEARARAFKIFEHLDALEFKAPDSGDLEPQEIKFSDQAGQAFAVWADALEHRLRGPDLAKTPHFHSHVSKYRSLVPSLAVVFHLIELANTADSPEAFVSNVSDPGGVSAENVDLALEWVDWLELHARKVYGSELNGDALAAHALARKIAQGAAVNGQTIRELGRKQWAGLNDDRLELAVGVLEGLGWLRFETVETNGKPRDEVRLHPDLCRSKGAEK
jgi:Protein of unknown function (DUF3987)